MAGELKYAEAIRRALADELASDPNVVVMGQEIEALGGVFTATQGLAESFEGRVLDTPLAESATVGWAIGAAMAGLRPVVEIMFMDFIATAMDQIVNGAAKLRYMSGGQITVPIVIRTPSDAGTGHGPSIRSISRLGSPMFRDWWWLCPRPCRTRTGCCGTRSGTTIR